MLQRRHRAICALAGFLLACSQAAETGSDPPSETGGSTVGGSSTGITTRGGSTSATGSPVGGRTTAATQGDSPDGSGGLGGGTPSGNVSNVGGTTGSGVAVASGGSTTVSASSSVTGTSMIGGSSSSGGTRATGGTSSSKGSTVTGGSTGGTSTKGSVATGGAIGGTGGAAGSASVGSKRGIAANVAPGAAFYPSVRWWYNWAIRSSGANVGIEFVPMVWNQTTVSSALPSGSKYLLGFNEPNFFAQANLSPTQAAGHWPALQANAESAGVEIVGPGMNFCGPASQCHGTDPYQYLKDFFAACTDCKVDYVAVHWYNCDLPSLRDYLEPGGNLAGFEQFGKPIWLTEFSCDPDASIAQQEAYMRAAIPYLESNPKVARYSWFSADPIPNAKLINSDSSPTALGRVYLSLPHGQ